MTASSNASRAWAEDPDMRSVWLQHVLPLLDAQSARAVLATSRSCRDLVLESGRACVRLTREAQPPSCLALARSLRVESRRSIPPGCQHLQQLRVAGCGRWRSLSLHPAGLLLRKLHVSDCGRLLDLPADCTGLQHLWVSKCGSLAALPPQYTRLQQLIVSGCDRLTALPAQYTQLRRLVLFSAALSSLPPAYPRLQELTVCSCDALLSLPAPYYQLQARALRVTNCKHLSERGPPLEPGWWGFKQLEEDEH